jgi:hypothetical protein
MLLLLCGYLSGANTVTDLSIYAEFQIDWINKLLNLRANYLIGLKGNQARDIEYKGVDVERYITPPEKGHGKIENNLHWILDVIFKEDEAPVKSGFMDEYY